MTEEIMNAISSEVYGVWFLIGAALVFWMQAGFAMVEAGFTRAKNTGNIIMKNLMDFCIGTVMFILIGFGLFLGEDVAGIVGKPGFDIFTNYANFDFSNFVFNSGLYWLSSQFTKTLCESVSFEFNHSENFSLSNRALKIASKVPGIILLEKNDLIGNLSRLSEHAYPHTSKIGRNSSIPARITILLKSDIVSPLLKNMSPNL